MIHNMHAEQADAGFDKETRVRSVFAAIAGTYDAANDRISLGLQRSWKRMLLCFLKHQLKPGNKLLDVCCGTGDICLRAAESIPGLQSTGLDFSPEMLKIARAKRDRKHLEQVLLIEGDARTLPFEDRTFEAAVISFGLRNTVDYQQVLTEMTRVVKPGGWIYCLDSFVPECRLIRPFYRFYFQTIMPLLGGGRTYQKEYRWLSESTESFLNPEELICLFQKAGCRKIRKHTRMFGACVLIRGQVSRKIEGGKHECR